MSQYSEMIGSFIRTGNYPIEADYIFATEADLKSFYSDSVNAAILHKGLLKIVEADESGKQALYWVSPQATTGLLEFTKLITASSVSELLSKINTLTDSLTQEIQNRKDGDNAIWGTEIHSEVPENLNSIYDLATALTTLNTAFTKYKDDTNATIAEIQATIQDILTNGNLQVEDTNSVNLDLQQLKTKTVLKADVLISSQQGNSIIVKNDGLYHKIITELENGILTLKVNGTIISQHNLGSTLSGIKSAYYDTTSESIVITFNKLDGTTLENRIAVANLIREWIVDNSEPSNVVVLTKEEVYGSDPDKLSADVRISTNKYNILAKESNTLFVKGTADNITWNDVKVSLLLDKYATQLDTLQTKISTVDNISTSLTTEIDRATAKENEILSKVVTDEALLSSHINNTNNPHQVTKTQVGLGNVENLSPADMPISTAVQTALNSKAALLTWHEQL